VQGRLKVFEGLEGGDVECVLGSARTGVQIDRPARRGEKAVATWTTLVMVRVFRVRLGPEMLWPDPATVNTGSMGQR